MRSMLQNLLKLDMGNLKIGDKSEKEILKQLVQYYEKNNYYT
ncbi:MAG: hypothetical protein Ct9H90mP2_10360 [Dehalococcoidia bacterium]|nr:MAG: hypothetical protein Ct9H90mP2_10360 [Dehalococcoidia bacterium]